MAKVYLTYANGTTPIVKAREIKVAAPFDVRTVVDTYEDLYDNTVFERSELYLGMPVITLDTYDIYILTAIPGKKQTSAAAWAANIGWKKIGSGSVDPSENLDYYKDELGTKVVESIDEIDEPYAGQIAIVSGSSNEGEDGLYVYTSNNEWLKVSGVDGQDGTDGQNGQDGAPGLSAYELAIANMEGSDVPTEEEWIASLKGADGKDGKDGVDGLPGKDGIDGKDGLDGKDGKDGQDGANGLSAYELAILNLDGSDVPTEEEWLASLKGADGKDGVDGLPGKDGVDGKDGLDGKDGADGKDGKDGLDGAPGLSAYELAIANMDGSDVPTEEEWLESLKATMSNEEKALIESIPDVNTLATKEDIEDVVREDDIEDVVREEDLEDYTSKEELVERIGIVGQEVESNVYEYIYNKASWEASYADGVLKEYYTLYPNEDLWNFDTNSAPGFNDKIYTCEVYTDAACEGEYEVKQFHAQWYSDNGVQRIYDVEDPLVDYYIPTFFDTPTQIFELFAGAEGGYVATPDDLVYPAGKWIKVKEVSFGGPNVRPAWEAAVQAPGAQFPWIALKVENVENQIVKFEYEGKDPVYPWGEKRFGLGGKAWGIASVAKEWEENGFLIQENANNGDESWSNDENGFDISKFKLVLVTPSSVKDYVDAAISGIELTPGADGQDGAPGADGANGLSAYELAIANMEGSDVPTEEEWLASLKGADGKDGKDGADGKDGLDGQNGSNGLSAYELAIAGLDGSDVPTEEEWLESLKAVISPEDQAKIDALPTQGSFPADSELEDEPINGFATVQDVMEYVDALFEKKKEELTEPDYIFVNGTKRLNASTAPTNTIYQMNRFEITDDILTNGLEVVVPMEANGYYAEDSPVDTIYSEVFSIEVPAEYTVTVYGYDDESPTGWSTVAEPMVVNPKYATKEYAGKTYNCYSRRTLSGADDDYAPIGQYSPYSGAYSSITSYKIIINK